MKKSAKGRENLVYTLRDMVETIKSKQFSAFFINPVDEARDVAPNYYNIVKRPMCLSAILSKLRNQEYVMAREIHEDLKLVAHNCKEYNTDPNNVVRKKLEPYEQCIANTWKKTAEQQANHGIDLETETLDYSEFDPSLFDQKKMTKEQVFPKALMAESSVMQQNKAQRPRKANYNEEEFGATGEESSTKIKLFLPSDLHRITTQPPQRTQSGYYETPNLYSQASAPGYSMPMLDRNPSNISIGRQQQQIPMPQAPVIQRTPSNQYPMSQPLFDSTPSITQTQFLYSSKPVQEPPLIRNPSSQQVQAIIRQPPLQNTPTPVLTPKQESRSLPFQSQIEKNFQFETPKDSQVFDKLDSLMNFQGSLFQETPQPTPTVTPKAEEKKPVVVRHEPPRKAEPIFERPNDQVPTPKNNVIKINLGEELGKSEAPLAATEVSQIIRADKKESMKIPAHEVKLDFQKPATNAIKIKLDQEPQFKEAASGLEIQKRDSTEVLPPPKRKPKDLSVTFKIPEEGAVENGDQSVLKVFEKDPFGEEPSMPQLGRFDSEVPLEQMYPVIQEKYEPWDSIIKFMKSEINQKFQDYANQKIPKYTKKFQKHLKRMFKWIDQNKITDNVLVRLRVDLENAEFDTVSTQYSKALLLLINASMFSKYNYEMDTLSADAYKKVCNLVGQTLFYLKELINLRSIYFTEEDNEEFKTSRRIYREQLKDARKKFREEKGLMGLPNLDLMPSISLRRDQSTKISLPLNFLKEYPKKHKPEMKAEETVEDVVRNSLKEEVDEIKSKYESDDYKNYLRKKVKDSWKPTEESKDNLETTSTGKHKLVLTEIVDLMQEEAQQSTSSQMQINFSIKLPEQKKIKTNPVFRDEEEPLYPASKLIPIPEPSYARDQEIYCTDLHPSKFHVKSGRITLKLKQPMNMKNIDIRKIINLSEKAGEKKQLYFKSKQFSTHTKIELPHPMGTLCFIKIAFAERPEKSDRTEKLEKSDSMTECTKDNFFDLTIDNVISFDALQALTNISDQKHYYELKLKDYANIMKLSNQFMACEAIQHATYIAEMMRYYETKLVPELGMSFSYREDPKDNKIMNIYIFTVIEDPTKFRLRLNEMSIV